MYVYEYIYIHSKHKRKFKGCLQARHVKDMKKNSCKFEKYLKK